MNLIRRLNSRDADFAQQLQALQARVEDDDTQVAQRAKAIVLEVKSQGDAALLKWSQQLDRVQVANVAALEIAPSEWEQALQNLPAEQRQALEFAAKRIRAYHQRQAEFVAQSWQYEDELGAVLGQVVRPLTRVGIYVPGGKAAYPSSVLMNAIPAQVAGVEEIIMVAPMPDGVRNPLVLAAAKLAGVHRVFAIGGAQAVAALAYGTATVPKVDKIVGPGNAYVAAAKRLVFGACGIDMIAGPSEVLILADGSTHVEWAVLDLFSQAEHDEQAQAILLCPSSDYLDAVQATIERLLPSMPRHETIRASLQGRGALIQVRDLQEACAISNQIAPEHLEVQTENPRAWLPSLHHAGAVFLGSFTSESIGDYCAGPNHVLPTSGTARYSQALGVYDFIKRSSVIEVNRQAAHTLGQCAHVLASGEGLSAHALAAQLRYQGTPA